MNQPSPRDVEQISAYLDGQLSQVDAARLESRIRSDPQLRSVYEGLHQSRAILRQLPARRAPRNFRLTPKMAGVRPPMPRAFPVFRLASALAAILFFLGYTINLSAPLAASTGASAAFPYNAAAPSVEMSSAPTEASQAFAPKFAPSQAAGLAPQDRVTATETPAEATTLAVSATEEPAETLPQPSAGFDPYAATTPVAPQPSGLPIHPLWLFGFLGLAVVSGVGAFVVRVRAEQRWNNTNAAGPVHLRARDLLLMTFVAIVVLLLAAAVYRMSTGFSAPVSDVLGGESSAPASPAQEIPFTPSIDNNFGAFDGQGQTISIDFPADTLKNVTALYYLPAPETVAPEHVAYVAGRAFSILASPTGAQLQTPMTIWVDYDEKVGANADENKLTLYWWSGSQWLDAAATCAPVSTYSRLPDMNQISIPVCQFGTFLLVAP